MSKVIAYCWELGGGLGHVNRMKSVINQLEPDDIGHIHYLVRQPEKFTHEEGVAASVYQAPYAGIDLNEASPNFSHIVWRSGWHDDEIALQLVQSWMQYFKDIKPDWVFLDHAPTAAVAAHILDLKYYHFGNGFEIPPAETPFPHMLPWQKVKKATLLKWDKEVNSRLQKVIKLLNRQINLKSFQQLFRRESCLIISEPFLDHYAPRKQGPAYLPLLTGESFSQPEFGMKKSDKPGLFVYLVSDIADIVSHLQALSEFFDVFGFISGLDKAYVGALNARGLNISGKPVCMRSAMAKCELVLCHGGMGTVTQALFHQKALFLMPRHVEQQLNAYKLEKAKRAIQFPLAIDSQQLASRISLSYAAVKSFNETTKVRVEKNIWPHSLTTFITQNG